MKNLWDLSRVDVVCLLVYCDCRCKGQTALETQSGNTARTTTLCVSLCVYFGLFFCPAWRPVRIHEYMHRRPGLTIFEPRIFLPAVLLLVLM